MVLRFPKNFLFGAGVSSHQTEGNNTNNDWWHWEQQGKTVDKSGWATDSWHRYKIDHELAAKLGCGAYRISFEWSRIEPEEGTFSEEAFEHYEKVLKDIKARGMKRVVTLWHYTVPLWFEQKYNWDHEKSASLFVRYSQKVLERLGKEIDILITQNESRLPLNRGYLMGTRPPGKRNPIAFLKARKNMVAAHKEVYRISKKLRPNLPVGITQYCNDIDFFGKSPKANRLVEKIEDFYNWHFFKEIGQEQDFIGINYYLAVKIGFAYPFFEILKDEGRVTDMGWGIYPEGLHELVMDAWNMFQKPIYVFENGLADKDDKQREFFIKEHLKQLHRAIENEADVRGYFYWSLLDNFEWEDGFEKRFGLVRVDYKTMERTPRKSYYYYQKIIRENAVRI